MASDVQAIKNYIASNQAVIGSKAPALSALDDELMSTTLSASLMANAEASQPWSTIGFDQWIGAGKWWLLRAQLVLRTIGEREQSVAPVAYADLIKAGWILADVIPCHPQFPFISASKSSELRSLSAEVKNEFSRVTTLAMVVPALDELCGQDLRLWESIPVKAPILRPYKVSRNLDAWRVAGGEHVLFRRFAFRELDSVTSSPCILLLLVHESARAARLIAQDQYGDIVKAISFTELSVWEEEDGVQSNRLEDPKSVIVGEEKFVLSHVQDAQVLCTMIEATTFYILGRQVDHFSLEYLKAYMLLTAVKNQQKEAVVQIRQESPETGNIAKSNQKESLARLAVSMASQWIEGRLFQDDKDDSWIVDRPFQDDDYWIEEAVLIDEDGSPYRKFWNRHTSLFIWAVVCDYTKLVEFILSENPVVDRKAMSRSAEYGNEPAMRWFLSNARAGDIDVVELLYVAIENGRENVVALLVEACMRLDPETVGLPGRLKMTAFRSAMSEPVVHAILAMVYATESQSDFILREAADRGHEGAIVLSSYAETVKRLDSPVYFGIFQQVVAALARTTNIVPAFDLTLMTVERQRTQVLLKVRRDDCVRFYLDSYHAYIEDVSEGLLETYKKLVTVKKHGQFSFTVVHQEENLKFTVGREVFFYEGSSVEFVIGGHSKRIDSHSFEDVCVVFPIDRPSNRSGRTKTKQRTQKSQGNSIPPPYISTSTQNNYTYQRRRPSTPPTP